MSFPRPVTALHQIEISSRCNLRCVYCPSHNLGRPKMDMSRAHFEAALGPAQHFVRRGSQHELNLAGIGESTLHPEFVDYVRWARAAVGNEVGLCLATNGLTMTEELAEAVAPYDLRVHVSLHRPEKAGPAIEILKRHGLLAGTSSDPSTAAVNWAGQVDWSQSAPPSRCPWLNDGWAMAMADGRITTCSFDATGVGTIGYVATGFVDLLVRPYALCAGCHQRGTT